MQIGPQNRQGPNSGNEAENGFGLPHQFYPHRFLHIFKGFHTLALRLGKN